jgi:hypothetical protein
MSEGNPATVDSEITMRRIVREIRRVRTREKVYLIVCVLESLNYNVDIIGKEHEKLRLFPSAIRKGCLNRKSRHCHQSQ